MVAGHLAIGLAVRAHRRSPPLAVCLLAAAWPDLVLGAIGLTASGAAAELYSHSLLAIGTWAVLAGIAVGVVRRPAAEGWWIAGLVGSHLPADWVTSRVALWPGGPQWGAGLYAMPWLDFVLEAALVTVGWVLYRKSLSARARRHPMVSAPVVVLLLLQGVWVVMLR